MKDKFLGFFGGGKKPEDSPQATSAPPEPKTELTPLEKGRLRLEEQKRQAQAQREERQRQQQARREEKQRQTQARLEEQQRKNQAWLEEVKRKRPANMPPELFQALENFDKVHSEFKKKEAAVKSWIKDRLGRVEPEKTAPANSKPPELTAPPPVLPPALLGVKQQLLEAYARLKEKEGLVKPLLAKYTESGAQPGTSAPATPDPPGSLADLALLPTALLELEEAYTEFLEKFKLFNALTKNMPGRANPGTFAQALGVPLELVVASPEVLEKAFAGAKNQFAQAHAKIKEQEGFLNLLTKNAPAPEKP
jgi:hypothetical protein